MHFSTEVSADLLRTYNIDEICSNYEDAIEAMSPDVFESLGRHGGGRMTKNRLRKVVRSVLGAWTNWSAFNTTFIDDLECKFEGREISSVAAQHENEDDEAEIDECVNGDTEDGKSQEIELSAVVSTTPRGTWISAENMKEGENSEDVDGESLDDIDGEPLDEIDGEPLDDADGIDGEELNDAGVEEDDTRVRS